MKGFYMKEKLISNGKRFLNLIKSLIKEKDTQLTPKEERNEYLQDVEKARLEWHLAQHNFNFYTANDLIDFGVYQINAAEKKYMHLLKEARTLNITAEQLHVVS